MRFRKGLLESSGDACRSAVPHTPLAPAVWPLHDGEMPSRPGAPPPDHANVPGRACCAVDIVVGLLPARPATLLARRKRV